MKLDLYFILGKGKNDPKLDMEVKENKDIVIGRAKIKNYFEENEIFTQILKILKIF